jgi:hypothetical protein
VTVATITKTPSNTWKAVVRKRGWPVTIKTFRTKRDAADWARSTAFYTGMRAGEIKSLTRRQVDLDHRTVHLTQAKNGSAHTVPLTRKPWPCFVWRSPRSPATSRCRCCAAIPIGVIQRSPLGYLKTLATRYRAGDMSVRYAIEPLL